MPDLQFNLIHRFNVGDALRRSAARYRQQRAIYFMRRELTYAELNALGAMLLRDISIEEIARVLRRDHREVRDKIAEVGRACR